MEKKHTFSRFLSKLMSGTSSNVEELYGRFLSLVRDLPLCGETPWKLREVERLLTQGASINARTCPEHWTALHCACLNKDFVTAELLVRLGINVNAEDFGKYTPMHLVVGKGTRNSPVSSDLIRLLHDYGANLNAINSTKETPLHLAAMQEDPSCARTLLSMGADFYMPSRAQNLIVASKGNRPLLYAVRSGRLATILLLLQYGDSFEDFSARSLLTYGYSRFIHFKIIKLFVEAGLRVPRDVYITEIDSFDRWPDGMKWLCSPLSLKVLCMKTIRKCMGKSNLEKVSQLPLPTEVKKRLQYDIGSFDLDVKCKQSSKDKNEGFYSFNIYGHKDLYFK